MSIAGQTKTAKADAEGKWQVKLDRLKVAKGLTLTVKNRGTRQLWFDNLRFEGSKGTRLLDGFETEKT